MPLFNFFPLYDTVIFFLQNESYDGTFWNNKEASSNIYKKKEKKKVRHFKLTGYKYHNNTVQIQAYQSIKF